MYVQGASLKTGAALLVRLLNSPIPGAGNASEDDCLLYAIGLAMCTAAHAQAVQWPEKKVRVEDGAALIVLAWKMRAELGQENADLAQTEFNQ